MVLAVIMSVPENVWDECYQWMDQSILRFKARKSSNYANPKWNNCIYLTPNLIEINTHASTLHSMIRKQRSKIGQGTQWYFNTQNCRCPNPTRTFNPKVYQAHKLRTSIRDSGHLQLSYWTWHSWHESSHYNDVIMTTIASQITSSTVVYSTVYSDADQRKHQSSASLAFVWGIHRDRWIPRTKGQLRGKCFHLMTSSW